MASTSSAEYAMQRFGMSNMTCLVTGGTKGLGAAVVEEMAALGAKVIDVAIISRSVKRWGDINF